MGAKEGISNSSRDVHSSTRLSRGRVQREKEKKIESDDVTRKKSLEKKRSNSKECKNDLVSHTSANPKDPAKKNLSSYRNRDRKKSLEIKPNGAAGKTVKDAKSNAIQANNKRKARKDMLNHSHNDSKLKNATESDGDECNFSKIENMIFDNHSVKEIPVKNRSISKRGKGKEEKNQSSSKDRSKLEKKKSKLLTPGSKHNKDKATGKSRKHETSVKKGKNKGKSNDSDSDESDWEEVEEAHEEMNELEALLDNSEDNKILAKETVKIELDAPDVVWGMKKRKKRRTEEEMIEEYLRRHVNRSIKEVYENMHKTHLLCLLAHSQYMNKTLNSDILLGAALSIITNKNAYPPKRLDMSYLEKFVNWFSRKITVEIQDLEDDYWNCPFETVITKRFESKVAYCNRELVYMFVVVCRALGMNVRLIVSLQPMSWKPSADALLKRLKEEKKSVDCGVREASCSKISGIIKSETEIKEEIPKVKNNRKMLSSDSDIEAKAKKNIKKNKWKDGSGCSNPLNEKRKRTSSSDENDSDFDPTKKLQKGSKMANISKKRNSSEGSSEGGKKRKSNGKNENKEGKRKKTEPLIEWAEIYVEEEEKWMCVDITRAKIHCIPEIEARTPTSSAYIVAFMADLTVKDVTRRYIASWLSNENKVRCCSRWWVKAFRSFRGKKSRLDKEEDDEMDQNLRQQPLPKVIGEYKKHPLYALQRHLLKFEAIYPPDEGPLGYIKSEPVFPRSSVYTLCSRDTWVKEAKTVRVGEEPYKIVKARPKWDRNTCQVIKDRPLEVFGEWQVEDFEPPVASGGKVPRSEYGSVELFKPTMLPKGCVHLPITGLSRIAKKLSIDCAPAMTGFDYHSGWSHPVYEGYVVCEEFKDILLDAWNEDQVEQAKRAEEKRQKRIYDNWKKLIRGMLVKERVRETYGTSVLSDDDDLEVQANDDDLEVQANDDTSKDHGNDKQKGKGGKKMDQKKPKVTQEDIDAVRPLITHTVQNLKIDLTSDVVDMAKESRNSTMKTRNTARNTVKAKSRRNKGKSSHCSFIKDGNLDDSSDETDEEEKKEKIRAILKWGTRTVRTNPDLSGDDSDNEETSRPSCSKSMAVPHILDTNLSLLNFKDKQKKSLMRNDKFSKSDDSESSSSATSRSTTPEPIVDNKKAAAPRKGLRRSAKIKSVKYEESDEGDISLDESDVEDKSYNPLKGKTDTLNLSESD